MPGVQVVHPGWLWCCAERWERVDENLFPLEEPPRGAPPPPGSANRPRAAESSTVDPSGSSGIREGPAWRGVEEASPVYDAATGKRIWRNGKRPLLSQESPAQQLASLSEKANPHLSMSTEQLRDMDREVEDACSEGDDDDEDEDDTKDARGSTDSDSSVESLSGGQCPRGWLKRKRRKDDDLDDLGDEYSGDDTASVPVAKFRRCELPEDSDRSRGVGDDSSEEDEYGASVGSVDEEMAAAVEREFLGL